MGGCDWTIYKTMKRYPTSWTLLKQKTKNKKTKNLDPFFLYSFTRLKYAVNNREDTRACHASGFCGHLSKFFSRWPPEGRGTGDREREEGLSHTYVMVFSSAEVSGNDPTWEMLRGSEKRKNIYLPKWDKVFTSRVCLAGGHCWGSGGLNGWQGPRQADSECFGHQAP